MERRLLAWAVASTAFLLIYISLNQMFGPPPQPQRPAADAPVDDAVADGGAVPLDDDVAPDATAEESAGDASDEDPSLALPTALSWQTLGSFDPQDGYMMLVTLNSRGGGIERIELTERKENGRLKYRRVDVLTGYLGYMSLSQPETSDGCLVNVVGRGTPVAVASPIEGTQTPGLQVGDVIVGLDDQPVTRPDHLRALLEKSEPGDQVELEVERPITPGAPEALTDEPPDESAAEEATAQPPQRLRFEVTLTEHPLDLVRLARHGGLDEIPGNLNRLSCLMTLAQVGARKIVVGQEELNRLPSQYDAVWQVEQSANPTGEAQQVAYRLPISRSALEQIRGDAVDLTRRYSLRPGSYIIDMEVGVENRGDTAQDLAYRLNGPNGLTLEGWWYSNKISPNLMGGAGARDVLYKTTTEGHELISTYDLIKHARSEPKAPDKVLFSPEAPEPDRQLHYIGIDTQYFTVAYLPSEDQPFAGYFQRAATTLVADLQQIPKHKERATNTSFFLDSEVANLAPGESLTHRLQMFAGPKQQDLLAKHGLEDAIYYGWFGWISRPLAKILHILEGPIGNYAIAIILLTLLVRGCMFPLGRKAAIHAQKMQELAPELKKINEKYKDDMEGKLKAQRELQQRAGFNPLSGCLPMLIQLPIFIGLYRTLSVDIELRQAALSSKLQWCSNLAGPDMLYYWGDWMWEYLAGRGTGWLGPYFNILPMIVVALFLAQQKLFMPPATDEQTAMTQKVMTIMTLMMGIFFFRVPSGLCIYFITSSLWGIGERKLVKKTIPPSEKKPGMIDADSRPVESKTTSRSESAGKTGETFADRIRHKLGNEPTAKVLPKNRKRPPGKKKG